MIIAISGPDGAGKSAVTKKLAQVLDKEAETSKEGHLGKKVVVIHFRPNLIPNIRELVTGERFEVPDNGVILPHTHSPSGFLGSIFRLLYYFSDYTIGYFFKVTPLSRLGKIVIFDRYYHDFMVDPLRSRIRLPQRLFRFCMHLIPQPDFTFILLASPELMRRRKPELTPQELIQQSIEYKALLPSLRNAYEISSEAPVDQVVEKIVKVINIGKRF